MIVDISKAEEAILKILPKLTVLDGAINTRGEFLVFDSIVMNEAYTHDIDYVFKLFVAISSHTKSKRLAYKSMSEILSDLVEDWEENQKVEIGRTKPYSNPAKSLIIYEISLTVKGVEYVEHH